MLFENFNATNRTRPYFLAHDNFVQDVQMVSCAWVLTLEPGQRCDYVSITPQCAEDVYIFNYIELFYCQVDTSNSFCVVLGIFGLLLCCGLLFLALGATADGFFCPALKVLSAMLGLNENVAGVTLLAFGNCAPDMITNLTGLSGASRRLYSDTLAAALFVAFCVAGAIVAFVPFIAQPSNFLRDGLFLILAVVLIDYCMITDRAITVVEGMVILVVYLFYILVVCLDQYFVVRKLKDLMSKSKSMSNFPSEMFHRLSQEAHFEIRSSSLSHANDRQSIPYSANHGANFQIFKQFMETINPIDSEAWSEGNGLTKCIVVIKAPIVFILRLLIPTVDFELEDHGWSKLLNCMQIVALPMFVTWAIGSDFDIYDIPLYVWICLITLPLSSALFYVSRTDKTPNFQKYLSVLSALGSVFIIYSCAAETISILSVLGLTTHRSNSFLGCTLLAWGNSVGDLVANIALARQGYQKMGFAACIGGPLFNILIGVGIGMTYKASIGPELRTNKKTIAHGTMGVNNTIFLIIGLTILLFGASTTNYILRRGLGIFMLTFYGIFLLYTFLAEMELIHAYGNDHRLDVKLEESDLQDIHLKSTYPFIY